MILFRLTPFALSPLPFTFARSHWQISECLLWHRWWWWTCVSGLGKCRRNKRHTRCPLWSCEQDTHTHTQKHFGDGVALQMTGFQMKMIRIKKSYVCVLGCLPLYQMYIIGGLTKPFGTKWVHFYDPGSGVVNLHDFQWFSSVEGLERSHHLFSSVTKNQPTWNIHSGKLT